MHLLSIIAYALLLCFDTRLWRFVVFGFSEGVFEKR